MIVRRGVHVALEKEANRLIRESLKGVTRHSAKSDILTPWKEAERHRREVYPTSGIADNTRRGMFHRASNPARPDLNGREGTAPSHGRSRKQSLATFVAENGALADE